MTTSTRATWGHKLIINGRDYGYVRLADTRKQAQAIMRIRGNNNDAIQCPVDAVEHENGMECSN